MALRPPVQLTMQDIPNDWHPMAQAAAWRALRGRRFGSQAAMALTGADIPIQMAMALQRGGLGSLDPYQFSPVAVGAQRMRRFDPQRAKLLDTVNKVKNPPPRKPTQLDMDIRQLRIEAEAGRGRQVTNRDVGHPLTPVRRPPTPRPVKPTPLTPRQQQARLSAELKQRRRGGV